MKKFLAIITARGGSKGIPRKNIKLLKGKPLIQYTIEAALNSKYLDRVVVSTENDEIARISKNLGAEVPCLRPRELARDSTHSLPVLQHMIGYLKRAESYEPYAVVTLQPTSPLRTSQHIDEAIKKFLADPKADSLVSVMRAPHNMTPTSLMDIKGKYLVDALPVRGIRVLRRQAKPTYYARNGAAIYITKTAGLNDYIFGGKILPYLMSKTESFDIDDLEDWRIVERLL